MDLTLQTLHVYSTLKRCGNKRFHVVSTWNTRGVFVRKHLCSSTSFYFNPFLANVPILNPMKTPENLWFSGVFRGCRTGTLAKNGLRGKLWKVVMKCKIVNIWVLFLKMYIQSNLSIEEILCSGHLVIADRFSRNRRNPGQTLIANPLYSGHFYSGHSLKRTLFLGTA